MQEVEGFINGTWNYTELKGDTGPLVYPAGFVYIYSIFYFITSHGTNIRLAQYIFAILYLLTLMEIIYIYHKLAKAPPYVLVFMCLFSYRVHSIFILRCFNDPVAILLLYFSIIFFFNHKWSVGCLIFSFAVSVKMNILLFAPGLFLLLLEACGWMGTMKNLLICAATQVVLAIPFLYENPVGYINQSFELGRQFKYEWTVNLRFLWEDAFLHRGFHITLLVLHLSSLALFAWNKWQMKNVLKGHSSGVLSCQRIATLMFTSNFIGMCFARSLHYQFYVWYYHTLPYLLWLTTFSPVWKLLILGIIEMCWNTFPSTVLSSVTLQVCHAVLLIALWIGSAKSPPTADKDV
ncbi:dol-P-Man:Man(5)GlcNAc(2)-PP-Dol alpha-1,3-mannosyltransferase-like isoform X2 [Corticium candelabrum]|nr:dol-P-Man:Man(5)GlcNAc(2)-PP-Dol alpha-1,3-mannosyltransferase-like isoform X2 [Corticium candelabrum]